jgi:hypothetical protein
MKASVLRRTAPQLPATGRTSYCPLLLPMLPTAGCVAGGIAAARCQGQLPLLRVRYHRHVLRVQCVSLGVPLRALVIALSAVIAAVMLMDEMVP